MTIPALPPLERSSPTFRADLDNYFLTSLPTTTGAINAAILEIDADVISSAESEESAAESASLANIAKLEAQAARDAAQASATSAVLAPGTSASSTTSLVVGSGDKTLTIQTGKFFSMGQWIVISNIADSSIQMTGNVLGYTSSTGNLVVRVLPGNYSGSGTFADWVVALTAAPVATPLIVSATTTAATDYMTSASTFITYFLT